MDERRQRQEIEARRLTGYIGSGGAMDPNDFPCTTRPGAGEWWERPAGDDRSLANELLGLPAAERAEIAVRDGRFHRLSLAQWLAVQAEEELFSLSGDPRPAAAGAVAVATALLAAGARPAAPLARLAWWLLGKGLLRSGHRRQALQAFGSIRPLLCGGFYALDGALMSAGMAQAYEDRGEPGPATLHWLQASLVFRRSGAMQPAAACQALLGFHLIDSGDPENATTALGHAAVLLEPEHAPALAARVWLGLAEAKTALGEPRAAAEAASRARELYELERSTANGRSSVPSRVLGDRVLRGRRDGAVAAG